MSAIPYTCICDEGYELGNQGSCDTLKSREEPSVPVLPVIVAAIGLFVFGFALSALRLREALRMRTSARSANGEWVVRGIDTTIATLGVHLRLKAVAATSNMVSNISSRQVRAGAA